MFHVVILYMTQGLLGQVQLFLGPGNVPIEPYLWGLRYSFCLLTSVQLVLTFKGSFMSG